MGGGEVETLVLGPFTHNGMGTVKHSIADILERNHTYAMKVIAESVGETRESNFYILSE